MHNNDQEGLLKQRRLGRIPSVSNPASLVERGGGRILLSNMFAGNTDFAGPETTFWKTAGLNL